MATILLGMALVGIFAILMSTGLIVRGKEIKGTCASQNPLLMKEGGTCGACGKPVENCENKKGKAQLETI